MGYLENQYVKIWIEEGVLYEVFKPGATLDLSAAKLVLEDRLKVSNEVSMPIFVDMTELVIADNKARAFMGSKEGTAFLTCGAFLINNELNKLLINIFIKFSHPSIPTRFFTNKEKAMQWLEETKKLTELANNNLN